MKSIEYEIKEQNKDRVKIIITKITGITRGEQEIWADNNFYISSCGTPDFCDGSTRKTLFIHGTYTRDDKRPITIEKKMWRLVKNKIEKFNKFFKDAKPSFNVNDIVYAVIEDNGIIKTKIYEKRDDFKYVCNYLNKHIILDETVNHLSKTPTKAIKMFISENE